MNYILTFLITMIFFGIFMVIIKKNHLPIYICIALFFYHIFFSFTKFIWGLNKTVDADAYYQKGSSLAQLEPGLSGFGTSTEFIIYIVKILCSIVPLTKLELFYIFGLFSFVGTLLFFSLCFKITKNKNILLLVMFLPSLHWWTSGIGKEPIIVTCFIGMAYLIYHEKYFGALFWGSVVVALIIRPHIAFLFIGSFCLVYILIEQRLAMYKKVIVLSVVLIALIVSTPILLKRISVDSLDSETLKQRIELQVTRNDHGGSSVDLSNYSIPERLFSYMFRPLFFDAKGILGLVASIENLIILILFMKMLTNYIKLKKYFYRFDSFSLFLVISVIMVWLLLGYTTSNLGLAIRQKTQITPFIFYLYLLSEYRLLYYKSKT